MKRNHLLLAVILLGLFSCSSTHKVATWKSPDFEAKPYKKLLVWGLSDNVSVRATVEDEVAYFLNVKGIASVSGSDIAPPDRKALPNNIDDAKAVLEKNGFDCVMTMGLIDKKEKQDTYREAAPIILLWHTGIMGLSIPITLICTEMCTSRAITKLLRRCTSKPTSGM